MVISQSSWRSNTSYHIDREMNWEFFLKKSRFFEIFTVEKSYERPQKDPRILRPPALDSDSLDDSRFTSIGNTICLSLTRNC